MRRPNRVFTRRIAVALSIDPRNDAESVFTSRTFAEFSEGKNWLLDWRMRAGWLAGWLAGGLAGGLAE
ncbi:hypothetical protein DPMN_019525 [Dreissena polymorpha]|uniref:Uncharacterized protein n=1 Tax=Dreissena polymorpha TaxID=45954 RepID=A0A9D4NL92_DREPO|nr:hypothetical protein DPMN_019525 [Dreissena polymorpha]